MENLVGEVDVAILCVIAFVLFFLGLVYYLRQEDKREGYPLERLNTAGALERTEGFPPMPPPKLFHRPHGRGTAEAPRRDPPPEPVGWRQGLDGYPIDPTSNPREAGVGAASWQRGRQDKPDLNVEGDPKIVPLSKWDDYYVAPGDPDLRGWPVVSADGHEVGRIVDLWFNRAEFFLRYLEVDIGEERTRMMPLFLCNPDATRGRIEAYTLPAAEFPRIPITGSKDYITQREEDRIGGFFAGGLPASGLTRRVA